MENSYECPVQAPAGNLYAWSTAWIIDTHYFVLVEDSYGTETVGQFNRNRIHCPRGQQRPWRYKKVPHRTCKYEQLPDRNLYSGGHDIDSLGGITKKRGSSSWLYAWRDLRGSSQRRGACGYRECLVAFHSYFFNSKDAGRTTGEECQFFARLQKLGGYRSYASVFFIKEWIRAIVRNIFHDLRIFVL